MKRLSWVLGPKRAIDYSGLFSVQQGTVNQICSLALHFIILQSVFNVISKHDTESKKK